MRLTGAPPYSVSQTMDLKWAVHKSLGFSHFEHCGYIFDSLQDAYSFIDGNLPAHYVRIDWDRFPAKESFIEVNDVPREIED